MDPIDEQTGQRLVLLARRAIGASLSGESPYQFDPVDWPILDSAGVFVTLRKGGALRGCMGTFSPTGSLLETICDIAVAATRDPRFARQPVSLSEHPALRIELSVLSPRERIADPMDFEIGRHGLYLRRGHHVGCFLPDVAVDAGWGKEKLLSELCLQKAGLSGDAWREAETEIEVFTVQKFYEE